MMRRTAPVRADDVGRCLLDPDATPAALAARLWAAGLGRHADELVGLGRRAARLVPGRAAPRGAVRTRLGGDPDLPPHVDWPVFRGRPQRFLAQIDLGEVHAAVDAVPLPAAGTLLFFRHDCPTWSSEHDVHPVESATVIAVRAGEPVATRAAPVATRVRPLHVVPELTYPADLADRVEARAADAGLYDTVDQGQLDELLELVDGVAAASRAAPVVRLLGHASPVGRDPVGPGCSLLLQLDGAAIGDEGAAIGALFWWMRNTDLAAGNWHRGMWEQQCG